MTVHRNKRNRNATNDSSNESAASGGTTASGGAALPSYIYSGKIISTLRGTKLEPLSKSEFIAAQPKELQTIISEQSSEMLDLMFLIKQRETSLAKFESGSETSPYIPTFLRKKNPILGSTQFKDNERIKAVVAKAAAENEAHAIKMAGFAAELSKEEVRCREELLHIKLCDTLQLLAEGILITIQITMPSAFNEMDDMQAKESTLAHHAVLTYLNTYSEHFMKPQWRVHGSKSEFINKYRAHIGSNSFAEIDGQLSDSEKGVSQLLCGKLTAIMPQITHELWGWHATQERARKANAEIKVFYEKRKQAKANEDVEMAFDTEQTIPPEQISNLINSGIKKALQAEKIKTTNNLRKNSSGGAKSQALQPTKNGQKNLKPSKNTSTKSRQNRRGRSKERSHEDSNSNESNKRAPSALKKTVRWPNHGAKSQQRSRSRPSGGRGESRSAGRGRGGRGH